MKNILKQTSIEKKIGRGVSNILKPENRSRKLSKKLIAIKKEILDNANKLLKEMGIYDYHINDVILDISIKYHLEKGLFADVKKNNN